MNKLYTFILTMIFFIIGCSGDDPVSGGINVSTGPSIFGEE